MITWFIPSIKEDLAPGNSTLKSICHLLQPAIIPASIISEEIFLIPKIVNLAIGGNAKIIVAITPALVPIPKNMTTKTIQHGLKQCATALARAQRLLHHPRYMAHAPT